MTIRVLLCPPLFFAQRRLWFSFVMNGIVYAVCVFSIVVGVFTLIVEAEGRAFFFGAVFPWLLCFAHVADARRQERAPARPPVSLRSRVRESMLIVAVPAVMTAGLIFGTHLEESWTMETGRIADALWEASWIVEKAQQYQRVEGRSAGSIAELRQRFPEADIGVRDPWSRDWVLSNSGDLWVCSHGPTGTGHCPPENLGAVPSSAAGSIGYSARFGRWQGEEERGWLRRLGYILSAVLLVAPLPGYIAYRIIRRVRGHSVPRLRTVSGAIVVVVVAGILGFIASPCPATFPCAHGIRKHGTISGPFPLRLRNIERTRDHPRLYSLI